MRAHVRYHLSTAWLMFKVVGLGFLVILSIPLLILFPLAILGIQENLERLKEEYREVSALGRALEYRPKELD